MKKLKVLAILTVVTMVIALLAACGGSQTAKPAETAKEEPAKTAEPAKTEEPAKAADKKIKIGISYQNLQNEFITAFQDEVKKTAEKMNVELIEADGQGKAETQISQIENFISNGCDALILYPYDMEGCAPAVDIANAAKVPIVIANSLVSNVDEALTFIGSNHVESGKIEMEYIAKVLNGKGNIAILYGPMGHSAQIARKEGLDEVLKKYPDIKIVAEQTAEWSRAKGMNVMENWLQSGKQIDCVAAQNDEMALGAMKALEAAGKLGEVKVIGIDAIPDALKAVKEGKFIATVFQDARGQGAKSVEVAVMAVKGEKVEKEYMIPFLLITQENVDQYLK